MKWILFQQQPQGNRVRYLTSEMGDSPSSMEYWKFLNFLQTNFKLDHFNDVRDKIDSFQEVFASIDGTWEAMPIDPIRRDFTMTELLKVNENIYETAEEKRKKQEDNIVSVTQQKLRGKTFPGTRALKWFDRNMKKGLQYFD